MLNLSKDGSPVSVIVAPATNKGITVVPFNLFCKMAHSYIKSFQSCNQLWGDVLMRILNEDVVLGFQCVVLYPLKSLRRNEENYYARVCQPLDKALFPILSNIKTHEIPKNVYWNFGPFSFLVRKSFI